MAPTSCAWPCAKRCAKFASCRRAWRLPTSRILPSAKPYSWWRKSTSSSPARFAQEGLNNAYRHAGGAGQALRASKDRDAIEIKVSDRGPGTMVAETFAGTGSQGLSGLKLRVESLGGTFWLQSSPGQGTTLSARLPILQREVVS